MSKYFIFLILSFGGRFVFAQNSLNCTLLSNFSYGGSVNDTFKLSGVWGYAKNGREYALVGVRNGLSVVDVTNPTTPVETSFIPGTYTSWREIKTYKNYAYQNIDNAGSEGISIIELSSLPDSAYLAANYNSTFTRCHNIWIDTLQGYLYTSGANAGAGGVRILDLSNPLSPAETGSWESYYSHDIYVVNDTAYASTLGWGIAVLDVSNKTSPYVILAQTYAGNFTHNAWTTDDHKYLYTTDEVDGAFVRCWDISNISSISQVSKMQSTPGATSIPHNVYMRGRYAVVSYYKDGLVIFDIACPDLPVVAGYYDTSPAYSGGGFKGAWGAYPYLPSGNILVSDMEEGLYVIQFNGALATRMKGKILDPEGNALEGVFVSISGKGSDTTDFLGDFGFGFLNGGGNLTVTLQKKGYATFDTVINFTDGECKDVFLTLPYAWDVDKDWSMITFPFLPSDSALAVQIPTAISLFEYDGNTYNSAAKFTRGKGYWLNNSVFLTDHPVTGPAKLSRKLEWNPSAAGWLFLGGGSWDMAVSDLSVSGSGSIVSVWDYNPANGYKQTDTLKKGKGYWVNVNGPMNAKYDAATFNYPEKKFYTPPVYVYAPVILSFTNTAGQTHDLGVGFQEEQMLLSPELPPLPPLNSFDIRIQYDDKGYKYMTFARDQGNSFHHAEYVISFQSDISHYPIEINLTESETSKDGIYSLSLRDAYTGKLFSQNLVSNQKFVLGKESEEIKKFILTVDYVSTDKNHLNQSVSVLGVYPNPFQTSAQLVLSLREDKKLGIKLFDITGKTVYEVKERMYASGIHTIPLSPSVLSNGMYYCAVRSSSGIVARKIFYTGN